MFQQGTCSQCLWFVYSLAEGKNRSWCSQCEYPAEYHAGGLQRDAAKRPQHPEVHMLVYWNITTWLSRFLQRWF